MNITEKIYDPTIYDITKSKYLTNEDLRNNNYSKEDEILYIQHMSFIGYENREDNCCEITYKNKNNIFFLGRFIDNGNQINFKYKDKKIIIYETKNGVINKIDVVYDLEDYLPIVMKAKEAIDLFNITDNISMDLDKFIIYNDTEKKRRNKKTI